MWSAVTSGLSSTAVLSEVVEHQRQAGVAGYCGEATGLDPQP
jgi:hypothetical protein